MIMGRAAVPPGQSGQNGHALARVRSQLRFTTTAQAGALYEAQSRQRVEVAPIRRLIHGS